LNKNIYVYKYMYMYIYTHLRYNTLITRRAQGCKQAGCRRRQERRSSPSDSFNSKHFTNSHEERLYPNPLGVNVSEVFLHTIGVSESPWLFRSPFPCSVPWRPLPCSVPWQHSQIQCFTIKIQLYSSDPHHYYNTGFQSSSLWISFRLCLLSRLRLPSEFLWFLWGFIRMCYVFFIVCFVMLLFVAFGYIRAIPKPSQECPRAGTSVPLDYCALLVCVLNDLRGLAVWRLQLYNKRENKIRPKAVQDKLRQTERKKDLYSPGPSRPGSALRHGEVADCPEVADSVDAITCPVLATTSLICSWKP